MVTVIGLVGTSFGTIGDEARKAISTAGLVMGEARHIESLNTWALDTRSGVSGTVQRGGHGPLDVKDPPGTPNPRRVNYSPGLPGSPSMLVEEDADTVSRRAASASREGVAACILASGDPGFFGIVRSLLKVMDRRYLRILPAPSSVSLAFARLAMGWEDAVVVTLEEQTLADAIRAVRLAHKAAVLTSAVSPPEMIGLALESTHSAVDMVAVCSRLGCTDESVDIVNLHALATGTWDPCSVVILVGPAGRPIAGWGGPDSGLKPLSWGLPDNAYIHERGMVTEAETRAVVLGKLALPATGVLWDVGAGTGAIAIEAAMLCPDLTVFAIEERELEAARITQHAAGFNVNIRLVHGKAPLAFRGLPDPDRVFVGGGGIAVLEAALARLSPGGRMAATFKALDHAAGAADRLGHLIQVSTNRGRALPGGGWQLDADDPVFLAWGPTDRDGKSKSDTPGV